MVWSLFFVLSPFYDIYLVFVKSARNTSVSLRLKQIFGSKLIVIVKILMRAPVARSTLICCKVAKIVIFCQFWLSI